MIDGKLHFGAYQPIIPLTYQEHALTHSEHQDRVKDDCTRFGTDAAISTTTSSSTTNRHDSKRHDPDLVCRSDYCDAISCALTSDWLPYRLLSKQQHNHDTCLFTFALPNDVSLKLPVTAHLLARVSSGRIAPTADIPKRKDESLIEPVESPYYHVRPYTAISPFHQKGSFTLMVKRYDSWGTPEAVLWERYQQQQHQLLGQEAASSTSSFSKSTSAVFYYTRTDHSYKPAGIVSNYIHHLQLGECVDMKFVIPDCLGRISIPLSPLPGVPFTAPCCMCDNHTSTTSHKIHSITMIAVGVGIAPMIRVLRALLDSTHSAQNDARTENMGIQRIRLLYGVRTVADILQRQLLDQWHDESSSMTNDCNSIVQRQDNLELSSEERPLHQSHPCTLVDNTTVPTQRIVTPNADPRFQVMYCIGSRWANVHYGAKTNKYSRPPQPKGFDDLPEDRRCLGWIDAEKVLRYGASTPTDRSHFVLVCGLPGVYRALVGPRSDPTLDPQSELGRLGFQSFQVVKF